MESNTFVRQLLNYCLWYHVYCCARADLYVETFCQLLFYFLCVCTGHIKRSVMTLKKLVSLYPDDVSIKNELGVGYLLMGDNNNAKMVYEEVSCIE